MADTITPVRSRKSAAAQRWLQVKLENDTHGVVFTDSDGDRLAMTRDILKRASEYGYKFEDFQRQFAELTDVLGEWVGARPDQIEKAFLTRKNEGFLFLVVQREKPFNAELEDDLTALDIKIAQGESFDFIRLSVQSLPPAPHSTIASFLSPNGSLVYENGQREVPPETCQS